MINLDEIREKIEKTEDIQHWKDEAMYYWRLYLLNVNVLKRLRHQNRTLRRLLSDYVNK